MLLLLSSRLFNNYASSRDSKKHKGKKTILDYKSDFEPQDNSLKALFAVIATPVRYNKYEKAIKLPFVIQMADGKVYEIEADYKGSKLD